ncbi:MAG: hypothetical protein FAF04_08345 [Epsilonproteobacteria bacterium]|nr:hypothetical protein [Campylobacterota bacterium]
MELKQFLELFNPLPGNHYMQVTSKIDATTLALNEIIQAVEGEFRLALYTEEEQSIPAELYDVKTQQISKFNTPFRALPRDNDIVIFKDIFSEHSNPELLLRIAYTTLANTADVIIMEQKGVMDIAATKELLEKFEFRAPNAIDVLDEYDLVMAKKMHMWGNGL